MKISTDSIRNAAPRAAEVLANKSLFTSLDKNRDHALDASEFDEFMKSLGLNGADLFKKLDRDKNGKISFNEFDRALPEIKTALFKNLDLNKDGVIDAKEIQEFAKRYHFDPKKLMAALDTQKNGKVTLTEFVQNFSQILSNPGNFAVGSKAPAQPTSILEMQKTQMSQLLSQQSGSDTVDFFW